MIGKIDKYKAKQSRGYVDQKTIRSYLGLSLSELTAFLKDPMAFKRTIAATILGVRKEVSSIPNLIEALSVESKLYSKIAISEALGKMGKEGVIQLIPFLGVIGKNQHVFLPHKPFLKNNYPLPRDIIARTITKIGREAVSLLMTQLDINNKKQLSEGIDAIGYISYYSHDTGAKNYLMELLKQQSDDVIIWKIIRSLQSFSGSDVISLLETIINTSTVSTFVWEARRSLRQIIKNGSFSK